MKAFRRPIAWAAQALVATGLVVAACTPAGSGNASASPTPRASAAATGASGTPAATFNEQAVADFYRGKTVKVIVATGPGTGTDLSARIAAKHLKDLIPGQPTIVVQNSVGASGFLAANALYNSEPQDGTVIGALIEGVVLQQALGASGIQFDAAKIQWLGSVITDTGACVARTDTGIKNIEDIVNGKGNQLVVGAQAPGSTTFDIPVTLKSALGANFKIVTGYQSGVDILVAMDKKEVDVACLSFTGMMANAGDRLRGASPSVKFIVTMGVEPTKNPLSNGVPVAEQLATSDEAKQMIRAVGAAPTFLNSLSVGPGVPADRVAALRQAFDRMVARPEFKADVEQTRQTLGAKNWQQVTQIVQGVLGLPPSTLAKLKEAMR